MTTKAQTTDAEPQVRTMMRMAGVNLARRKGRRLPATRPSYAAELAYRAELLEVARAIRREVETTLLPALREEAVGFERQRAQDDFSSMRLLMRLDEMARALGGINLLALRMAARAVARQEDVTNRQLAKGLAQAAGADQAMTVTFEGVISALNVRAKIEAATVANAELIKSLPAQFTERVKSAVLNGAAQGQRYETIAREIQKQVGITEARAKFIARDQMSKLNSSITEAKQTALGITEYEWVTAGDERVRDNHRAKNGKVFKWSDPPDDTGHPGEDYQCFPGWSKVQFTDDVKRAFRHWYSGKLALLVTDAGETLYATPNHPVLTAGGWVPAQSVKEGDHLVHVRYEKGQFAEENQDHCVASISDVFDTLAELGVAESSGFGRANFHGDVPRGHVDVVSAAGHLSFGGHAGGVYGVDQFRLTEANESCARIGTAGEFLFAAGLAAHGVMRLARKCLAFLRGQSGHAELVGLGAVAGINPGLYQSAADHDACEAGSLGDGQFALAGNVSGNDGGNVNVKPVAGRPAAMVGGGVDTPLTEPLADEIGIDADLPGDFFQGKAISKELRRVVYAGVVDFAGHVYNLETGKGWYVTQGLATHNCRCIARPIIRFD